MLFKFHYVLLDWILFSLKQFGEKLQSNSDNIDSQTRQLAAKMGNITVLRKGQVDLISDGDKGKYYLLFSYTTHMWWSGLIFCGVTIPEEIQFPW